MDVGAVALCWACLSWYLKWEPVAAIGTESEGLSIGLRPAYRRENLTLIDLPSTKVVLRLMLRPSNHVSHNYILQRHHLVIPASLSH